MSVARIPSDELYFAVLDAPISRGRAQREELDYAFEAALPIDLSKIHASYRVLPGGRVLAVGIERASAKDLASSHHAATPESWPKWLDEKLPPLDTFNLLIGDAEPAAVGSARSRLIVRVAIMFITLSLAASIGLERRIRHDAAQSDRLRAQSRAIMQDVLGESAARTSQPLAAVMTSELRRMRATRGSGSGMPSTGFAGADRALAQVLSAWPDDAKPKTESITIAERSIELIILTQSPQEARRFVTALGDIQGLALATTSTSQDPGGTRLSIRLDRADQP